MESVAVAAILKVVAEYGVLGLGWVAWILTMVYLQIERKRYAALVVHIIGYFTKVNLGDEGKTDELIQGKHSKTFDKLFKSK